MKPVEREYGLILARYKDKLWLLPRHVRFFDHGEVYNKFGTTKISAISYVPNETCYEVLRMNEYNEVCEGYTKKYETEKVRNLIKLLCKREEFFSSELDEEKIGEEERFLLKELKRI